MAKTESDYLTTLSSSIQAAYQARTGDDSVVLVFNTTSTYGRKCAEMLLGEDQVPEKSTAIMVPYLRVNLIEVLRVVMGEEAPIAALSEPCKANCFVSVLFDVSGASFHKVYGMTELFGNRHRGQA